MHIYRCPQRVGNLRAKFSHKRVDSAFTCTQIEGPQLLLCNVSNHLSIYIGNQSFTCKSCNFGLCPKLAVPRSFLLVLYALKKYLMSFYKISSIFILKLIKISSVVPAQKQQTDRYFCGATFGYMSKDTRISLANCTFGYQYSFSAVIVPVDINDFQINCMHQKSTQIYLYLPNFPGTIFLKATIK